MDVKFIQIGFLSINVAQIIDIQFGPSWVCITTTEKDGDGNREFKYSGSVAETIKEWWEECADVYRIV